LRAVLLSATRGVVSCWWREGKHW